MKSYEIAYNLDGEDGIANIDADHYECDDEDVRPVEGTVSFFNSRGHKLAEFYDVKSVEPADELDVVLGSI